MRYLVILGLVDLFLVKDISKNYSFFSCLSRYLEEHKGSSVQTQDLWKSLNFGLEDGSTGVEEVMDLWTTRQGFPEIKVSFLM